MSSTPVHTTRAPALRHHDAPGSRRRARDAGRFIGLGLFVAALVLAGCASDGDDTGEPDDEPAPTGEVTIAVDPDGERTITHPLGRTVVPAGAERVVALGEEFLLADLLDLGVTPVASTSTVEDGFQGIDEDLSGIKPLPSTEPDLERLVALDPDLIITDVGTAELAGYDRLSAVAPTVAVDGSDWRRAYEDVAAVFGAEAAAADRLADYDDAIASASSLLDSEDRTVSVATVYPGDSLAFWVAGPTNAPRCSRTWDSASTPARRSSTPTRVVRSCPPSSSSSPGATT